MDNNNDSRYKIMENERLVLALNRIREIPFDDREEHIYTEYFNELSTFINMVFEIYEIYKGEEFKNMDLEALFDLQEELYANIIGKDYETSIYNPTYLAEDKKMSRVLAALALEVRSIIKLLFDEKYETICTVLELFLEVYGMFDTEEVSVKGVEEAIYYYAFDYLDVSVENRLRETFTPEYTLFKDIILNEDLSDLRYLFKFGDYVSKSALETATYLNSLDEEIIDKMAFAYTNGFKQGFIAARKDLSKKKYVNIVYELGFERVVKKAIEYFREMGLEPILARGPFRIVDKAVNRNYGCGLSSFNRQLDYDHRFDNAIFYKKAYTDRRLSEQKLAYEKLKNELKLYAGIALMEVFGEETFEPKNKEEVYSYDEKQKQLQQSFSVSTMNLRNEYLPSDESSFTIIAWPIPEIAKTEEEYKLIFDDIIKVNTLDYNLYQNIQQKLIDALDKAEYVFVEGANGNTTNMQIKLHDLKDPSKETNFENCVADVNIPVGEVFTSPVLTGTRGRLHVKDVFLWDIAFKDLTLEFENGMITSYTCKNFESEEENKKLIEDTLLKGHSSLPLGEFAIGTNTVAYAVGRKRGITEKLPILIAEKTGPHFAIGDTCYSYEEDVMTYNPDGKAIIARENECSALRKEDPHKAYFSCHTDITIPYHELGDIYALTKEGEKIYIIKEGRFFIEGSEELNKALDE